MHELVARYGNGAKNRPKYRQLHAMLLKAISDGYWQVGDRLPTETQLAAELPYSLGTVQRAYGILVSEGVVTRRRRSGTFVVPLTKQMPEPWHCRFLDDSGDILPVFPKILSRRIIWPGADLLRELEADGPVLQIDRMIDIAGEFRVHSGFFARTSIVPPLATMSLAELEGTNFKVLLMEQAGLSVASISQTIISRPVPSSVATVIGVKAGSPGMLLEATARTFEGVPIYRQEIAIPRTKRRLLFETHLRR